MKMVKLILLSIVLTVTGSSGLSAQYASIPDSNATWITQINMGPDPYDTEYYFLNPVNQDTLINDTTYSVLYNANGFFGGLYDNGVGQVFFFNPAASRSYLLYDFNVQPGDTVRNVLVDAANVYPPYLLDMFIETVDMIFTGVGGINGPHKTIGIQSVATMTGGSVVQWWIQGIGGTGGLLSTIGSGSLSQEYHLTCMSSNDTVQFSSGGPGQAGTLGNCFDPTGVPEFQSHTKVAASPNPSTGIFTLSSPNQSTTVYTSTGQELFQSTGQAIDLSAYPPGLYHAVVRTAQGVGHVRLMVVR